MSTIFSVQHSGLDGWFGAISHWHNERKPCGNTAASKSQSKSLSEFASNPQRQSEPETLSGQKFPVVNVQRRLETDEPLLSASYPKPKPLVDRRAFAQC
jgi:hypothetical protein